MQADKLQKSCSIPVGVAESAIQQQAHSAHKRVANCFLPDTKNHSHISRWNKSLADTSSSYDWLRVHNPISGTTDDLFIATFVDDVTKVHIHANEA